MEKSITTEKQFDEQELIQTLKTAIATSKRTLMKDGILLFCWGVLLSLGFFYKYLNSVVLIPSRIQDIMTICNPILSILLVVFTIYFIFFRKKGVQTNTAISTRFVWIGVIIAHNLNFIVTKSFLIEVNFELLHPLQMILIGFALFVTGGIYRYYLLSGCGIVMWVAAVIGVNFEINIQFLVRAIADFICFVVPGVLMIYSNKQKQNV